MSETTLEQRDTGDLDFPFWGMRPSAAPFIVQDLFEERMIGMLCASHPLASRARGGTLLLDDYLAYPHVAVSSEADPGSAWLRALLNRVATQLSTTDT